jgi:uncharacterized protein
MQEKRVQKRIDHLDIVRGFAVMGIVLMNIISFAMPSAAYTNPLAWGGTDASNLLAWAIAFILVDGKMRGLFSILFGASMLLVISRADAGGDDSGRIHNRRMLWLLVFGMAHYYLIWEGDILVLYAIAGIGAAWFVYDGVSALYRKAIILFAINFLLWAGFIMSIYWLRHRAGLPSADPALAADLAATYAAMGAPSDPSIARETVMFSGGYREILLARAAAGPTTQLAMIVMTLAETMGLIALGMGLFKSGFLTGDWPRERYLRWAQRGYAIGLPGSIALATMSWTSGFDTLTTAAAEFAWSAPFRIATTIGHLSLLMVVIARWQSSALIARVAAAGRMAFTNYLGTSMVMTSIFYGYGLGWFGHLTRLQAYALVPLVWVLMLIWSKPWLDHLRYGPLEWAWRSLARRQVQQIKKEF